MEVYSLYTWLEVFFAFHGKTSPLSHDVSAITVCVSVAGVSTCSWWKRKLIVNNLYYLTFYAANFHHNLYKSSTLRLVVDSNMCHIKLFALVIYGFPWFQQQPRQRLLASLRWLRLLLSRDVDIYQILHHGQYVYNMVSKTSLWHSEILKVNNDSTHHQILFMYKLHLYFMRHNE